MGKNKRGIYWTMMGAFMALIVMMCGVTLVESAKVATFHAEQTVTYNAPANIPVTLYANGGSFSGNSEYNTTLTFDGILNGSSLVPTAPTRTGYTLSGWKYSTDGTSWSASVISSSTVFPFTDHLYLQAQWSINTYTLSYNLNSGTHGSTHPNNATYNTSFTVSHPTRSGYDFIGWNITGMDSVTHRYGGSTTTNTSISRTTATTFNNLRSTSGTVTFTATWAQRLTIPSQNGTLTYSGSAQTPSWNNYDNNKMTRSVSSQTNAGNYSATFSLIDKTNYHWSDGSTTNKTVPWSIGQLAGSISYGVTALNKNVGDSAFTNALTKTGDGTVTYSISCSPSGVATINSSSGLVTLGSVTGTATVTATVTNSSNTTYATKTASYTITLALAIIETPIEYFTIQNNQITAVAQSLPAEVIIPSSVTGIMNGAFATNSSAVTSITIHSGVTGIGWNAFSGCTNLTSVTFEDTSNWYATNASINALQTVTNSSTNATMLKTSYAGGGRADCYWTKSATKPIDIASTQTTTALGVDTSTHLTNRTSYRTDQMLAIANIVVPYGIVGLEKSNEYSGPFAGYTSPGSGDDYPNNSIRTVVLPESLTSIGVNAFHYCSGLTSITIPSGVTSIGSGAFRSCTGLTSITIPASVTSIGVLAFFNCSNLTSVTFENPNGWWAGTTQLSSSDLSNTSTAATYLKTTYYSSQFTRYTPESFFYWNGNTILGFSQTGYNSGVTDIVIPSRCTAIGMDAFYYDYWTGTSSHTGANRRLTSVVITENVTSIGTEAFAKNTLLSSVVIKGDVSIGARAFYLCSNLASITISGGLYSVRPSLYEIYGVFYTISGTSFDTKVGEIIYNGTLSDFINCCIIWSSTSNGNGFYYGGPFRDDSSIGGFDYEGYFTIIATDGTIDVHLADSYGGMSG